MRTGTRWMATVALSAALLTAGCSTSGSGGGSPTGTSAAGTTSSPEAPTAASNVACSRPGARKLNLWYVNILPSYPAWGASSQLFQNCAAAGNYTATAVGPPTESIPTNISEMDQALADKANGIIFCDSDPAEFKAEVDKARTAGTTTVTLGCVDSISDYSIGTDNAQFGREAADLIAQKVGPDAQVGIVSTDQTTPNQVAQVQAFKARIASAHPGMKVDAWESGGGVTSTDAQKITAMVEASPGMNAVWCVEGTCPGGVQAGLSAAGKSPGQLFVVGIDDVNTTIAALKAGWVSVTLNQCYFDAVPLAVSLIEAAKAGHPIKQRSWNIPAVPITKADLPYKGCPASAIPTLP